MVDAGEQFRGLAELKLGVSVHDPIITCAGLDRMHLPAICRSTPSLDRLQRLRHRDRYTGTSGARQHHTAGSRPRGDSQIARRRPTPTQRSPNSASADEWSRPLDPPCVSAAAEDSRSPCRCAARAEPSRVHQTRIRWEDCEREHHRVLRAVRARRRRGRPATAQRLRPQTVPPSASRCRWAITTSR